MPSNLLALPPAPTPRLLPPLFAEEAAAINAALVECDRAATETLHWMIEAGRLLHEVWEKLPHGQFEAWVRANCRVTPRMARMYRQAYRRSLTLKPETISGFRRLRDLLRYCDEHDLVRSVKLAFSSHEQYEAYFAALRRHPSAVSDPVPYIIQALNALPVQRAAVVPREDL